MKYIELRGKKYKTVDDVAYNIVKKFKKLRNEVDLDDLDEELLKLLAIHVCPDLKIDYETMSIDKKDLTFGEVKSLFVSISDRFEDIINTQLSNVINRSKNKEIKEKGTQEVKNLEEVTEE